MHTLRKNLWSYHTLRILGLLILAVSVIFKYHEDTKLSFDNVPQEQEVSKRLSQPDMIVIKSVGIQLPVSEAVISHGVWQISSEGASHLTQSANPGNPGSIIIYAHNTNNRFGYLPSVDYGTIVDLRTKDNTWHTYKVVKTEVVDPSQTSILNPEHPQELILYTCYGFADLKRFVVRAVPTT